MIFHPHEHARNPSRARSVAMIRLLSSIGGVKRRGGRLPRQQQPDAIRLEYFNAIRAAVCEGAGRAFAAVQPEILRLLVETRRLQGKTDSIAGGAGAAAGSGKRAATLIESVGAQYVDKFRPSELHALAAKFGKRTSDFQRAQLDAQVRAAVGVPFAAIERPIRDKVDEFAAVNVDLIKTVATRYFDRLRLDTEAAFESGTHPETLAKQFADDFDISINDARRIARDQIGKLNGQVNQARQEALGVERYIWRGSRDNRERDNHLALEGQSFAWNDPPLGGGTTEDEEGNPGDGIQCRCYGEPDFSGLLDV